MALRLRGPRADNGSMLSFLRRHTGIPRRGEGGQAVVEFALILPLFIILVAGIIKFGIALNFWLDMQKISNQGARWAVVNQYPLSNGTMCTDAVKPCSQTLQTVLANQRLAKGENTRPYICFNSMSGNNNGTPVPATGDPVTVRITRKFKLGIPFLPLGVNLSSSATMRLEQPPTVFTADGPC